MVGVAATAAAKSLTYIKCWIYKRKRSVFISLQWLGLGGSEALRQLSTSRMRKLDEMGEIFFSIVNGPRGLEEVRREITNSQGRDEYGIYKEIIIEKVKKTLKNRES